jgi:hypothetical protein
MSSAETAIPPERVRPDTNTMMHCVIILPLMRDLPLLPQLIGHLSSALLSSGQRHVDFGLGRVTRDELVLLILVFCFFVHFFQDHDTLNSTRIEIALRDFLVDEILMAINAGGAFGFHLLVCGLG